MKLTVRRREMLRVDTGDRVRNVIYKAGDILELEDSPESRIIAKDLLKRGVIEPFDLAPFDPFQEPGNEIPDMNTPPTPVPPTPVPLKETAAVSGPSETAVMPKARGNGKPVPPKVD